MARLALLPTPGGTVSPQILDMSHYETLDSAIRNVLATQIARDTLSQIMDGLPLWSVFAKNKGVTNAQQTPLRHHTKLCDGAVDMAEEFITTFNTATLLFDASAFQNAAEGSRAFRIRLVELVARSIHCIATSIHHSAKRAHKGDIDTVTSYQDDLTEYGVAPLPPYPTLFYHHRYRAVEQYPFGASDMAGYWAEDQIFGGVVLFDRGESGNEANSVWLHSARYIWTMRVWKLLDWQLDALIDIFTKGFDLGSELEQSKIKPKTTGGDTPSPLRNIKFPFFCDVDNHSRHDDWDAMALHHIYRDKWERKLPEVKLELCTRNTFDYPETIECVQRVHEMAESGPAYSVTWPFAPSKADLSVHDTRSQSGEATISQVNIHDGFGMAIEEVQVIKTGDEHVPEASA